MSLSSRIFVRGLPPTYTEDDFRNHFGKRFRLTDTRCFPNRRIGYVGLKTPQDAEKAVKYFNKSFIRMSRIHVELAHGVTQIRTDGRLTAESRSSSSNAAAPSHDVDAVIGKRKRSAGDSHNLRPGTEPHPDRAGNIIASAAGSTSPYQPNSSLAPEFRSQYTGRHLDSGSEARSDAQRHETLQTTHPQDVAEPSQHDLHLQLKDGENGPTLQSEAEIRSEGDVLPPKDTNDDNWMRSRTSRLLGLDENESDTGNGESATKIFPASRQASTDHDMQHGHPVVEEPQHQEQALAGKETNAEGPVDYDAQSQRLFIRNLSYTVDEQDLRRLFERTGEPIEITCPQNARSGQGKGIAFVAFESASIAQQALEEHDGTVFQGRLLHILPAAAKRDSRANQYTLAQLPLKKRKLIQKRSESGSSTFNWNSMYMNPDAVVASVAQRLGLSKSELLDPSSSSAAVKQAQAETHVIQETKAYFKSNGVNMDAFSSRDRDSTALLVKNFPFGTKSDELSTLFAEVGEVEQVLMPPNGTIAIIRFRQKQQVKQALKIFSYRKLKDSVLFLEQAPTDLLEVPTYGESPARDQQAVVHQATDSIKTDTIFVRNLSFATTNERLRALFEPLDGFVSARIKTKANPKKPNAVLSMGFGFLEFRSKHQAQAALQAMNGYNLDGHSLELKPSHNGQDQAEERRKADQVKRIKDKKSKIIIKNVPFEASKEDLRKLFKAYGQLRTLRLPKKVDNSRKGFGFAEFTTPKEAENAIDALRDTHLLGRRLVLEFASGEAEDPEKEIEEMQRKIGRQSNSVTLQRLSQSERKKFLINDENELDKA
ncbi:MAG: Multiple RNA-binding domain-containing protein 1 [Chrysothrix sp. TS-e1954]|nr:MAG: Multiple RNA-binding domain-containing protein 1 [Chrysothrix sp. TS-e1954]